MKQRLIDGLMIIACSMCITISFTIIMLGILVVGAILTMALDGQIQCSILPTP